MSTIQVNDKKYHVKEHKRFDSGHMLTTEEGKTFIVFKSKSIAGSSSKIFWKSLADKNPYVFLQSFGGNYAEAGNILLKWSLGEKAGPGTAKIKSLKEWFELLEKEPHYGKEEKCEVSQELVSELKVPRFAICYDPDVV